MRKAINIVPELQPLDAPFLTGKYIEMAKIVFCGFQEGLMAAQAEMEKETT